MKRKLTIIILILICLLPSVYAESSYGFIDSTGNHIKLSYTPQRTAVLFSSLADLWAVAGGNIAITIGETVNRGITGNDVLLVDPDAGKQINLEMLLASEPDFIIGSADIASHRKLAGICQEAGIPTALFHVECFDDYLEVLKIFCDILHNDLPYITYGISVREEINALLADHNFAGKTYLFLRAASTSDSVKAKTSAEHFVCSMLNDFGLVNIYDQCSSSGGNINSEFLLYSEPDYIFVSLMGDESAGLINISRFFSLPVWCELHAVRSGQVSILDRELFHFKPNSRWAAAYKELCAVLMKGIAENEP
ncbi:MAG: ABC transporter substrate-binding protein [Clostridia bacterium]|nr:ABC transporter substrate-binding protein [Clostridia bacterium]